MKLLPASDPRSWSYQAAIHGTVTTPVLTAWNTCQHNALFFWSWHRMYLYWFERIVRKMAGDCEPCWTLPYWDWTSPTQRHLPAPFRDSATELFHAARKTAMNNGTGSLSAGAVDVAPAFTLVNFVSASSAVSGPHGSVHIGVGGDMGSVPTAAVDPIFYLHHSNVDRLWNLWIAQGGRRSNPLGDTSWRTQKFTFFDEKAIEIQMTGCQVLRAAEQLDYVYEREPDQVRQYCERRIRWPFIEVVVLMKFPIPPFELKEKPVSIDLALGDVRRRLTPLVQSESESVLLVLEEVEADRPPGIIWEVHVGAARGASLQAESPSFVGNVAMFGEGIKSEGHHEPAGARFVFPIRAALLKQLASGSARVSLTFVPRDILIDGKPGTPKPEASVRVGRVSLVVETRKEGAT